MSHDSSPVAVDPEAVIRAEHGWEVFTKYGKWVALHVIAILILMAIFLL